MAFPDQLKNLMNRKNMKAVDLARATGLSEAAISDYLKGKKEPRGRQSIAIAKSLNVSLDTLWETGFLDDKISNNDKEAINNFVLSATEKQIILEYRKSDKITQSMVLRVLSIDKSINTKGKIEKMA